MDSSVLRTLEFDKIIARLADCTGSVIARELAESLEAVDDFAEVERRLEETGEALDIQASVATVPLGGIRDIRSQVKRAELGSSLEASEFLAVGSTLYAARRIKQFFNELAKPVPRLAEVVEGITVYRNLEISIDNTVNEQGMVRDSASPELANLRREIRTAQHRVKEKLDSILHSSEYQKYFQDALVTIRGDRYVIPVKQEYRHHFPGIVHDQSASGATVFIEPMAVVNLNNDLKQMVVAEHNEVERILRHLSTQVAAVAEGLLVTCQALGEVDFAFAKARLAIAQKAFKPVLNSVGRVNLRQARHPLIAADKVMPIDVRIGEDFQVMVITGPNTGGKTVSLKTLGLFALMTQAGLFIPAASDSEMPVFANIFADIGDEQSIEQSLSTFSGHMTHLVGILRQVGPDDLVLIDEIGAGTDPDEGAALAMAILEFLHASGARTIATTHYSELKTFAYSRNGIENASVEFDIQTLRPTYRLLIGVPGSSKAFLISKRLGLDEGIIERAQQLVDEDYAEFDKVLTALEQQKQLYSDREREMAGLQREMETLRRGLADERDKMADKKNQILTKAQEEAALTLRRARQEAEEVISQLKAQFAVTDVRQRQQAIDGARRRIKDSSAEVRSLDDGASERGRAVKAGDLTAGAAVYVTSLGQKGTVLAVNGDEATVQLGIMKVSVPLVNCRLLDDAPASPKTDSRYGVSLARSTETPRQIDIRGTNIEEGEMILDKYLDDAVLAGLGEVIIIHGKGTGALKKGIRAYLRVHRSVKEIQIGEVNQGGDGVTVAKLK
ncbi:MAG: endonuclease MutS2 [Negativicutes bacterium]|nr:endonuclease MutS2 [Negativicutes bacterium]